MSDISETFREELNIASVDTDAPTTEVEAAGLQAAKPADLKALYQYAELNHDDSMRLLTLHPGETGQPIHVSLQEVRLSDDPEYNSLSYTWATGEGDAALSTSIFCEDARILVTTNCEAALQRLRKKEQDRVLWVDAICINQADNDERSQQVRQMRNIYRNASAVQIWLGDAAEDKCEETGESITDVWLDHLARMAPEIRQLNEEKKDPTTSPLFKQLFDEAYDDALNGTDSCLWDGFYNFQDRHWWDRIWVVQEAAFAKQAFFICGQRVVDYADFHVWYLALEKTLDTREGQHIWDSMGSCLQHLKTIDLSREGGEDWNDCSTCSSSDSGSDSDDTSEGSSSGSASSDRSGSNKTDSSSSRSSSASENKKEKTLIRDVFWMLDESRELRATDPRDKIFAILSLVDNFGSILGSADYTKSAREVFTSVVKTFLTRSKSLHILSQVGACTLDDERPSWVPDWANPPGMDCIDMDGDIYSTAAKSEAIFEIVDDDRELRVKGIIFDSIKVIELAEDLAAYDYYCETLYRIPGWKASCRVLDRVKGYPTGEPVMEALWRTLCWNLSSMRTERQYPASKKAEKQFKKWHKTLMSEEEHEKTEKNLYSEIDSFDQHIKDEAPLCVSEKNYFASVPCKTQVGDVLAILSGGVMPFVLRPCGNYHRMLGHCYVHGIMDGEKWPGNAEELEWISIR